MKKIEYRFTYNVRTITKSNFLNDNGFTEANWKRKCVRDALGNYHYGYYSAFQK